MVLLSLVILASMILTGCGSQKAIPEATTTAAVTTQEQSQAPELKPVELTWYIVNTPQNDVDTVVAETNKITMEKINATVKFNIIDWGAYKDKMNVIITSGEVFDMMFTSSWADGTDVNMAKGAFAPLDELLEKYGQNILKLQPKEVWDTAKYQGKIYALPGYPISNASDGPIFRKDLVEKYQFDTTTVKSLKDLTPYLETIKKNEKGVTPLLTMVLNGDYVTMSDYITGYYANKFSTVLTNLPIVYDNDAGKLINILDNPTYLESVGVLSDWYKKGFIAKDQATKKDYKQEYKTGKYAVILDNYLVGDGGIKNSAEYGYSIIDQPIHRRLAATGDFQGACQAISATSANPERAMMFQSLLWDEANKDLYNLFAWGVKDKHYKVIAEGQTPTIEQIKDGGYTASCGWQFGKSDMRYWTQAEGKEFYALLEKNRQETKTSPILGFKFDITPIKNEYAKVDSIVQEYSPAITAGLVDSVKMEEFKKKVKDAGLDLVMAEVEKQMAAWISTK